MVNHTRQLDYTQLRMQTSVHYRSRGTRLLMYLLKHEMRKTALLYLAQVQLQFPDHRSLLHALKVSNLQFLTALDECNLFFAQINHLIGIFNDRSGIGTHQELVIAHTNYERTALACGNHAVGLRLVHNHNGVCAYHTVQSQRNSLLKRDGMAVHDILYKLYYHLSIGLALEVIALVLKFGLE